MAPRARFELATLRLTANNQFNQNLSELVLIEAIQQLAMETGRITFSFLIHLSFASGRCSPPLVLRFYDGGLSASEDKQIFVAAGGLLDLTRHLTSHTMAS